MDANVILMLMLCCCSCYINAGVDFVGGVMLTLFMLVLTLMLIVMPVLFSC